MGGGASESMAVAELKARVAAATVPPVAPEAVVLLFEALQRVPAAAGGGADGGHVVAAQSVPVVKRLEDKRELGSYGIVSGKVVKLLVVE